MSPGRVRRQADQQGRRREGCAGSGTERDAPEGPANWVLRIVLVLVAAVAAFVAFRVSAAFFPRWWAQRVADQVQGGFTSGTLWGLFYGFVFTFVPLLLLFQIRRRFFNWTWRLIVVVSRLLLAAPNWLTLSVVRRQRARPHTPASASWTSTRRTSAPAR